MRDTQAPYDHFDREISELVAAIGDIRSDISARTSPDAVADFLDWDIHLTFSLNQFSAMYSRGYDATQLRQVLAVAIEAGDRAALAAAYIDRDAHRTRTELADYRTFLWLVSLAIAMDVTDEEFAAVKRATAPVHGDRLVDSLIIWRDETHPFGQSLKFPKVVGTLAQALTAIDGYQSVASYLASWGKAWKRDAALIPHKPGRASQAGPSPTYYGYRAFETLGVVAMLGGHDSGLRGHALYPADLSPATLHVRETVTWEVSPGMMASASVRPGEAAPNVGHTKYFEIDWEVSEVVWLAETLLKERGLTGTFSSIEEEAYEYEELGAREDGLEGHLVTIARFNYALQPHGWAILPVLPGRGRLCDWRSAPR